MSLQTSISVHSAMNMNTTGLLASPTISFVSLYNRYCTQTLYRYTRHSYTAYRSRGSVYNYGCGFWGWSSCTDTRYR